MDREWQRVKAMCKIEEEFAIRGFKAIAGVDEAGRGPLAGPVVAAVCILPSGYFIRHIDDSKKLTPRKREELYNILIKETLFSVALVACEVIDEINILQATFKAMIEAIKGLPQDPDLILVDGHLSPSFDQQAIPIVGGDALSISIAAASIIAKYSRDCMMEEFDKKWPEYGFKKNKGYGTRDHLLAIEKFGPCPIHRKTFEPMKTLLQKRNGAIFQS